MDALGSTNWQGGSCSGGHWLNPGDTIVTNCYVWRDGSMPGYWYRQASVPNGSRANGGNNGLFARWDAFSGSSSWKPAASMPACPQGPGQW